MVCIGIFLGRLFLDDLSRYRLQYGSFDAFSCLYVVLELFINTYLRRHLQNLPILQTQFIPFDLASVSGTLRLLLPHISRFCELFLPFLTNDSRDVDSQRVSWVSPPSPSSLCSDSILQRLHSKRSTNTLIPRASFRPSYSAPFVYTSRHVEFWVRSGLLTMKLNIVGRSGSVFSSVGDSAVLNFSLQSQQKERTPHLFEFHGYL